VTPPAGPGPGGGGVRRFHVAPGLDVTWLRREPGKPGAFKIRAGRCALRIGYHLTVQPPPGRGFREAMQEITGDSWLAELARASLAAAAAKSGPHRRGGAR
jgi:hypothetical protein